MRKNTVPEPSKATSRCGTTIVEFAVTAPLVFLLFFAAIEFSRVAMIRHTVDNAAYEATRKMVLPGARARDARREARTILASLGLRRATIQVQPAVVDENTDEVTVRIKVPIDRNTFGPSRFFKGKTVERELTLSTEGTH